MARNPWPENDLARAVMTNPVGTERAPLPGAPSMGIPRGPFNELMAMGPGGQPFMATDLDRAYAQRHEGAETAMGLVMGMTGNAPGFRAFHGSPHSFERFDTSKIGTGEGAQMFGRGLYVAENEGVARGYRDKLSPSSTVGDLIDKHGGDAQAAMTELINKGYTTAELDAMVKYRNTGERPPKGSMYEVQVNADPAHFLDWDKPLSEQSAHVREALAKVPWAKDYLNTKFTGSQVVPHTAEGSEQLRAAGIPGIRYLDAGSRRWPAQYQSDLAAAQSQVDDLTGALQTVRNSMTQVAPGSRGHNALTLDAINHQSNLETAQARLKQLQDNPVVGTSNHVIFDDSTMEILRKYGIAGLIAGGGAGVAGAQQ